MIELKNINITSPIFLQGTIQLEKGKITLLCGENGTGKTTLFYQIAMLEKLHCDYYINQTKIKNKESTLAYYRKNLMAITLQNDDLNSDFIVKNYIRLFCKISQAKTIKVKEYLTLFNKKEIINQKVSSLSGGEKALLSLSLAFSKDAKILVLDEPTSSLDTAHTNQLIELLKKEKLNNKIICILTHDQRIMEIADHKYEIIQGKVELKW